MVNFFGPNNPALKMNRAIGRLNENILRTTMYLDRRLKGKTPYEARLDVVRAHFDYTDMTDLERQVFRRVIPFWTWSRNNTVYQLQALARDPWRLARIGKAERFVGALSPMEEDLPTPDYFDQLHAVRLPILRKEKPVYINPNIPFQDINRLNWRGATRSLTPFIGAGVEAIAGGKFGGYDIFLERPRERFRGEESTQIPGISLGTEGAIRNLIPPIDVGLRALEAVGDEELAEFLSSHIGGVKLIPLDVQRERRNKVFQHQRVLREIIKRRRQKTLLESRTLKERLLDVE